MAASGPHDHQRVGMIEAPEVNITSRIAGRITRFDLLEGDQVTSGTGRLPYRGRRHSQRARQVPGRSAAGAGQHDAARSATSCATNAFRAANVIATKDRDDARHRLQQAVASVASNKANVEFYKDQLATPR